MVTLTITNFVDVSNGWYFTPFEWLKYNPERVQMEYSASKVTAYWMEGFAFDHFTEFTGKFTYKSDGSLDYGNSRITGITLGKTLDNHFGNTSDVQYSITKANFVLADALAFGNERYYTKLLSGSDLLVGNDWGNVINGYSGNDRIYGNAGNDTLTGGDGSDTLWGGTGADTLVFDKSDSRDTIQDFSNNDTIRLIGGKFSDVHIHKPAADGYTLVEYGNTDIYVHNVTGHALNASDFEFL